MARETRMVMKPTGKDRWTATRLDGQTIPVISTEDPIIRMNDIQPCQQDIENRPNVTIQEYGYLENGKLFIVEESNVGTTTFSFSQSSFEIDETDCFVWIQKVQNPRRGLTCIVTIKQTRGQEWGS